MPRVRGGGRERKLTNKLKVSQEGRGREKKIHSDYTYICINTAKL